MLSWNQLPDVMKNDKVKKYYIFLKRKQKELFFKRIFDLCMAVIMLIILSPVIAVVAVWIKLDSRGPVFFRQERVTRYGRVFRIYKFRTMVQDADKIGAQVTTQNDSRITKVGQKIRKFRLDEIPQLLNVISGDMSFVGTRPEVKKYVDQYTDEMYATLLLPAGITSEASIKFKDEDELLKNAEDVEKEYVEKVLPLKMKYNLKALRHFSLLRDFRTMIWTVKAVLD